MTMSIITLIGVRRKPMLKVNSSVNFIQVKLNTVTVGNKPSAPRPSAKK